MALHLKLGGRAQLSHADFRCREKDASPAQGGCPMATIDDEVSAQRLVANQANVPRRRRGKRAWPSTPSSTALMLRRTTSAGISCGREAKTRPNTNSCSRTWPTPASPRMLCARTEGPRPGDWPISDRGPDRRMVQEATVQRVSDASDGFGDFAAGESPSGKSSKCSKGVSAAVAKI